MLQEGKKNKTNLINTAKGRKTREKDEKNLNKKGEARHPKGVGQLGQENNGQEGIK
jgi:hypothetical protein